MGEEEGVRTFLKVYMELDSYFLFLQEQIQDIIIIVSAKVAQHFVNTGWGVWVVCCLTANLH